jgi:hypothetical protein
MVNLKINKIFSEITRFQDILKYNRISSLFKSLFEKELFKDSCQSTKTQFDFEWKFIL